MHYRTAQRRWTPTNWAAFCRQATIDANQAQRRELLARATNQDLSDMYADLMRRRAEKHAESADIEDQLRDIDRERVLRSAT